MVEGLGIYIYIYISIKVYITYIYIYIYNISTNHILERERERERKCPRERKSCKEWINSNQWFYTCHQNSTPWVFLCILYHRCILTICLLVFQRCAMPLSNFIQLPLECLHTSSCQQLAGCLYVFPILRLQVQDEATSMIREYQHSLYHWVLISFFCISDI